MVGPDRHAAVDEVLHPVGEVAAEGWMTLGRQPERHGGLHLEEAVEDPEAAEADAQDLAARAARASWRERAGTRPPWALSRRHWIVRTTLKPMAQTRPTRRMIKN